MPPEHSPRSGDAFPASSLRLPPTAPRTFTLPTRIARLINFGLVGGLAFVVDIGVYNLLRITILDDKPIGAKIVSVAVATLVAWIGNRHLTFRQERSRPAIREAFLFGIMNVIGLAIAAGCLFVSHYLLGFTSQLADNIAGNGVGLVLGMIFRFLAYRYIVFRPEKVATPAAPPDLALPAPTSPAPTLPTSTRPSLTSPAPIRSAPPHSRLAASLPTPP